MTAIIKPRWFVALSAFAATVGVIASWPLVGSPLLDRLLAYRWSLKIEQTTDEEAAALIDRVAQLGRPGIPILVKALGHSRAAVAQAAASAIRRQMDGWRHLPPGEASANIAVLAASLVQHADGFGASARAAAEKMATMILRWPLDRSVDRAAVIADCGRVLLGSSNTNAEPPPRSATATAAVGEVHRQATSQDAQSVSSAAYVDTDIDAVPGGNLPLELVEIPSLPPSLQHPHELVSPDPNEPRPLPPTIQQMPRLLFPDQDNPSAPDAATIPTRRPARHPAREPSLAEPKRAEPAPDVTVDQLSELPTREVMNHLHATNAKLVKAAQDELIARGFDTYELGAARRLGSPEPADRQELADALSALPLSPVRWLLWLSQDKDARVRLSAISLMATSSDPRLTNRLLEMQATERDRRVSELLDRWYRMKRP
jgi:hypothetical protein